MNDEPRLNFTSRLLASRTALLFEQLEEERNYVQRGRQLQSAYAVEFTIAQKDEAFSIIGSSADQALSLTVALLQKGLQGMDATAEPVTLEHLSMEMVDYFSTIQDKKSEEEQMVQMELLNALLGYMNKECRVDEPLDSGIQISFGPTDKTLYQVPAALSTWIALILRDACCYCYCYAELVESDKKGQSL